MSGYWDMHCHILPGVDDGSSCMEETVDLIADEYKQGIRHIVFTPHLRKGMFEISEEDRYKVFQSVVEYYNSSLNRQYPGMEFLLGCELHMHPDQSQNIQKKIYRMPGEKMLLTEFSTKDDRASIMKILFPLLRDGYRCIIAHAERYKLKEEDIRRLHETNGIYIQCNADAVLGRDGFACKLFTRKLLSKGLIDLIGSDGHNMSDRSVHIGECVEWITRKHGEQKTDIIFEQNPQRLFKIY